jgi:hypothetical protein
LLRLSPPGIGNDREDVAPLAPPDPEPYRSGLVTDLLEQLRSALVDAYTIERELAAAG